MNKNQTLPQNIDAYLALFDPVLQERMQIIRQTIKAQAPEVQERMAYGMPTFYLYSNVIHFACFAHHIGIFPGASGVEHFMPELGAYKTSKGTIQIPHTMDLPLDLIRRIVDFRVAENIEEGLLKKRKKHV